jgi:hypothetical protein
MRQVLSCKLGWTPWLRQPNNAVGNNLVDVVPGGGGGCSAHGCFLLVFAVAVVVAVACDIHAERHLAKAGGSKRKLRDTPWVSPPLKRSKVERKGRSDKRRSAQAERGRLGKRLVRAGGAGPGAGPP